MWLLFHHQYSISVFTVSLQITIWPCSLIKIHVFLSSLSLFSFSQFYIRCSENSTLFLPDVCGIQYTGQGILFEILAGPIYLIVQGVTIIPVVGLIQWFSLRPPFVIGLFTMLWTLCTFITAYVNDYWAIALLRFLFGVL